MSGGIALLRLRPARSLRPKGPPPFKIAFFLHLPQDAAVLRDLVAAACVHPLLEPRVWLSERLHRRGDPALTGLGEGMPVRTVPHWLLLCGRQPELSRLAALVTAAESSMPAHWPAHALAIAANARGIATYTLQHGLENVGLTYVPAGTARPARFASRRVLIWGAIADLAPTVPAETRSKCISLGRPLRLPDTSRSAAASGSRPLVCVFENLHWERYEPEYRARFFADLEATARARPELRLVLRPHPGVQRRKREHQAFLDRLEVAEVTQAATDELLDAATAVITTPSTIALDAAYRGLPVAVAAHRLDLPRYAPLPLLHSPLDWQCFLDRALMEPSELIDRTATFRRNTVVAGDAVGRILDLIIEEAESTR